MIRVKGGILFQWDTGRKLIVDIPQATQIDISKEENQAFCYTVDVVVENGRKLAPVPNILLQDAENLVVYAVKIDNDERKTIATTTLHIRQKAKPEEYVYTETEVYNYRKLEQRLDELFLDSSGTVGVAGATFVPSVSAAGVLSWTNNRDLDNPSPFSPVSPFSPRGP